MSNVILPSIVMKLSYSTDPFEVTGGMRMVKIHLKDLRLPLMTFVRIVIGIVLMKALSLI